MRTIELFAGIGGMALAMPPGFELVAAFDQDEAARAVHSAHHRVPVLPKDLATISEAELLVCRSTEAWLDGAARVLLGPTRAHAQHDHRASPFALVGPFRVSLVSDAATLGAFTPPPGHYCGVHVELGPAADDGDRAPWTITLRARTADGAAVLASSDGPGAMHLEFDAPLVLTGRGTTVLHASFYEETTFARLPALIDGEEALGAALLRGVSAQGAIRVEHAAAL